MTEKWTLGPRLPRRIVRTSLLLLLCLPLMGQVNAAGEYVVTTISDSDPGDPILLGSLRWAIEQANNHPGPDVIRFNPSLTDKTILLASSLPPLTDNGTTIDASPNWVGSWPTGEPGIGLTRREFDSTAVVGLHIKGADNCIVKGLRITSLPVGIFVSTGDDPGNRATGNTIGAGSPGGRMLIRNCGFDAIRIDNSDSNRILGCYIGASKAGNLPEPNGGAGVYIYNGRFNEIGRTGPLEGNLIGASQHGVWIEGSDAVSNIVQANGIGVGMLNGDIGNRGHGVFISLGASQNQVGGASPDSGNSILNNDYSGVFIGQEGGSILVNENSSTPDDDRANLTAFPVQNSVTGNYIADNSLAGIEIQLADNNTIQGNTIVRNGQSGVYVDGGDQNDIYSNFIGADESGTAGLGNGHHGVGLYNGATLNGVSENVIAQNNWSGVAIVNNNTLRNSVVNNYIGVTKNGQPLGNGYYGVGVVESWNNTL